MKIILPEIILDIGSGTGLLSLMIAQKSNGEIHAIEIDENSFSQSKENFIDSPWENKLQAFNADIKSWNSQSKYDFIISNPPFFENDLKSKTQSKNLAKHHDGLTL
ncbi:MAG TPA: methyltransferase, partial [Hanamia sp.]|nr:methyltransferase [Hanamia sp.]